MKSANNAHSLPALFEGSKSMRWMIIITTILLDQLSKYLVIQNLKEIGTIKVIEGFFHLHYLENRGAAFGLLQNQRTFFIIMTVFIIGGILWYLIRHEQTSQLLTIALSLIVGGAVGNFIDRVRFGYVVDFFDFLFWPVFNIADAAIVIGQLLLLLYIFKDHVSEKEGTEA
jgi:signal peptidase II